MTSIAQLIANCHSSIITIQFYNFIRQKHQYAENITY